MMLSIIIVSYNSHDHIKACLNSVVCQMTDQCEVIVVDNGSADGTGGMVKNEFNQVQLIENCINGGACRARNQGIDLSAGEWVLTLDSDVVLPDGFIKHFFLIKDSIPDKVGMLQSNILNSDHETIYSQGIYLSCIRRFFDVNRGKNKNTGHFGKKLLGPCSAAAFYRRHMLDQLKELTGFFDERFFFLVEDVDLAWRAQRAGWAVIFDPQLLCYHEGNGSRTGRLRRQFLSLRNRHLMIRKNEVFSGRVWVYCMSMPYELMRWGYFIINFIGYGFKK